MVDKIVIKNCNEDIFHSSTIACGVHQCVGVCPPSLPPSRTLSTSVLVRLPNQRYKNFLMELFSTL